MRGLPLVAVACQVLHIKGQTIIYGDFRDVLILPAIG
jgi:hypothetical protein